MLLTVKSIQPRELVVFFMAPIHNDIFAAQVFLYIKVAGSVLGGAPMLA